MDIMSTELSRQINFKLLCLTIMLLQDAKSIELRFALSDLQRPWPPLLLSTTGTAAQWSDWSARSGFQHLEEQRTAERNFNTTSNWTQTMDLHYDELVLSSSVESPEENEVTDGNLCLPEECLFIGVDTVLTSLGALLNLDVTQDSLLRTSTISFQTNSTECNEELDFSTSMHLQKCATSACEKCLKYLAKIDMTWKLLRSSKKNDELPLFKPAVNKSNINIESMRIDNSRNGGSGATVAVVLFMMAALLHLYELQVWDLIISYWKSWYRRMTTSSQIHLLMDDTERHMLSTLDERNFSYSSRNWRTMHS